MTDSLYDSGWNGHITRCQDRRAHYTQERIGANGTYYASPVAADGRIYFVSQPGKLTVVKTGGDQPAILHQAEFGERVFATPALIGENLYLRTETKLYAWASSAKTQ
jgi:hypothetical protein